MKTSVPHSQGMRGACSWKLLVGAAVLFVAVGGLTAEQWLDALCRGLVHNGGIEISEVAVVENLEIDYLLFERAAQLVREGWAARVLVPVQVGREPGQPAAVQDGIVRVLAGIARLEAPEMVPVREEEPITLQVAMQVRDYLQRERVKSVIVVTQGFRSRRSFLSWNKALQPAGITVFCVPVFGRKSPENWRETWHGRLEVALQFLKLQYYRLFIL